MLSVELARGLVLPHKLTAGPGGGKEQHTHAYAHTYRQAHTHWMGTHTQKKLYAQHKAGCWSNYRNMAEHDEAGPTIRREIE